MDDHSERVERVEFQGDLRPEAVAILEAWSDDPVIGEEARRLREAWSYVDIMAASVMEQLELMEQQVREQRNES